MLFVLFAFGGVCLTFFFSLSQFLDDGLLGFGLDRASNLAVVWERVSEDRYEEMNFDRQHGNLKLCYSSSWAGINLDFLNQDSIHVYLTSYFC